MKIKVHNKENMYFIIMSIISLISYFSFFSGFWSKFPHMIYNLIFFGGILLFFKIQSLFVAGYLKGNAIRVNERQFPEAFRLLQEHAKTLQLKTIPHMYVLQGDGLINAFAIRLARKNYVVLLSDVLDIAYEEGIDAVSFIIGHELGHIKRNHVGFLKTLLTWPASWIPLLGLAYSRACEYTSDNIGYQLCPEGAIKGALLLAAGKKLYKKVNVAEILLSKSAHELGFDFFLAEICSSHPAIVNRIAAIDQLNKENFNETPFKTYPIDFGKGEQKSV